MKRLYLLVVLMIAALVIVGCEGTASQPAAPYERPTTPPAEPASPPPADIPADTEDGTTTDEPAHVITPTNVLGRDASIVVLANANPDAAYAKGLKAIAEPFQTAYPEITVSVVFTTTDELPDPIPADLYVALSKESMDAAIDAGLVVSETTRMFAQDPLMIVVNNEKATAITNIRELATPNIKVALVDEENQRGGHATAEFLDKMNEQIAIEDDVEEKHYRDDVLANATFVESAEEVIALVASGEADAGIAFQSSITSDIANKVQMVEIAYDFNVPTLYPIGVVSTSSELDAAQLFVDFALSNISKDILWENGAIPAE